MCFDPDQYTRANEKLAEAGEMHPVGDGQLGIC
jgi:hypothetical protein